MIRLRRTTLLACLALAALSLSACRQGVGDRCQVTGDCDDNLICIFPPGATPIIGGKCERNDVLDLTFRQDFNAMNTDFRVEHDASVAD